MPLDERRPHPGDGSGDAPCLGSLRLQEHGVLTLLVVRGRTTASNRSYRSPLLRVTSSSHPGSSQMLWICSLYPTNSNVASLQTRRTPPEPSWPSMECRWSLLVRGQKMRPEVIPARSGLRHPPSDVGWGHVSAQSTRGRRVLSRLAGAVMVLAKTMFRGKLIEWALPRRKAPGLAPAESASPPGAASLE